MKIETSRWFSRVSSLLISLHASNQITNEICLQYLPTARWFNMSTPVNCRFILNLLTLNSFPVLMAQHAWRSTFCWPTNASILSIEIYYCRLSKTYFLIFAKLLKIYLGTLQQTCVLRLTVSGEGQCTSCGTQGCTRCETHRSTGGLWAFQHWPLLDELRRGQPHGPDVQSIARTVDLLGVPEVYGCHVPWLAT